MIKFNKPLYLGIEEKYVLDVIKRKSFSGKGYYYNKVLELLKSELQSDVILTFSATTSLEISAFLLDINPGDEVIMPSFTYVSTANAFVKKGAKLIFVDISPKTMNIDESLIKNAITKKTKAILVVHYAGVSCNMDKINEIARKHNIAVIEDAAHSLGSKYKGKPLGTLGDLGIYSFHETKNIHCGEGGALIVNNKDILNHNVDIFCEMGTDRKEFSEGKVGKYSWQDVGTKCIPDEFNTAFLYAQLLNLKHITKKRLELWDKYYKLLSPLAEEGFIELPYIPEYCEHNAHIFYIKLKNKQERKNLMDFLKSKNIETAFHFIPLHSSPAGKKYGYFFGEDVYTTKESSRLLRLPLYFSLKDEEIEYTAKAIKDFFKK